MTDLVPAHLIFLRAATLAFHASRGAVLPQGVTRQVARARRWAAILRPVRRLASDAGIPESEVTCVVAR